VTNVLHQSKLGAVGIAATLAIALIGAVAAQTATAKTTPTVNWRIAVTPSSAFPRATGSAQYQSQPGQREFQIEVDGLGKLVGKYVTFYANGVKLGIAKVSSRGSAQVDCNTELGQAVPSIVHGSGFTARAGAGVLVASGRF
jgi:hypothetical protein